jgi:hypothetical protein
MWATYPKVICQPTLFDPTLAQFNSKSLFEQNDMAKPHGPESLEIISKKERFYKLTTLRGKKLRQPWWCSVRYGPWAAWVTEVESCDLNAPPRWSLYIGGTPEVSFAWDGLWSDIPSIPSLTLFPDSPMTFYSQEYECCGGFSYCHTTRSCLSNSLPCQDNIQL